jgi:tRNA pseudouridine32 synthase/23S rRNA pseudouridine746 synthase
MGGLDTSRFHLLTTTVEPPDVLNNPFGYEPHPLTLMAADAVRNHLKTLPQWADVINPSAGTLCPPDASGKMFGVLVCTDTEGRVGFIAAYSGQIDGRADWPWFVPAVFDYLQPDGYFKQEEARITAINRRVEALEHDKRYVQLSAELQRVCQQSEAEIADYQALMREAKRRRDERRGETDEAELIRESQFQKAELRRLKRRWAMAKEELQHDLQPLLADIEALKQERKQRSDALQCWLFDRFVMLNGQGEGRTLTELFSTTPQRVPPSGAGECCAPKLFQYAFLHHLKPLCIGEFWQGCSPKMEIRHHNQFYPACRGKCKPILEWMLSATPTRQTEVHAETPDSIDLMIVYEDDCLLVVNKPSGLLSVPGLNGQPSVESLLHRDHAEVFMVHRLDQDTSGLMVVALTSECYHHLQRQFLERTVFKQYVALLDGKLTTQGGAYDNNGSGTIRLPLRPDPLDRPRQVVDREHGKAAVTDYCVIAIEDSGTRVLLTPHTGRTHQLRVHCAHTEGLGLPIKGDNLYGHPVGSRLCLHATTLAFTHPKTGRRLQFESPAPF